MAHQNLSPRSRSQNYTDEPAELAQRAASTTGKQREIHGALAELAHQLAVLGDPVGDALAPLTPEEFATLAWRLTNPSRTKFLMELRVPPARRPTTSAAAHGLSQLRSWPGDRRRHGVRLLTITTLHSLSDALHTWRQSRDDTELHRAVSGDPLRANAVRLAALSHWATGPDTVAMLRIVADGQLALPSWSSAVLADIVAACRQVEDLWTDDDEAGTESSAGTEEAQKDSAPDATAEDWSSAWYERRSAQIIDSFERAGRSANQISMTLHEGHMPSPDSFDFLDDLRDDIALLRTVLAADSGQAYEDIPQDRDGLVEALSSALTSAQSDRTRLAAILRLTLVENHRDAGSVIDLRTLAESLYQDRGEWSEEQDDQVAGLSALADLIDADGQDVDAAEIATLFDYANRILPTALRPLAFAAMRGHLQLPAADDLQSPAAELPSVADEGTGPAERAAGKANDVSHAPTDVDKVETAREAPVQNGASATTDDGPTTRPQTTVAAEHEARSSAVDQTPSADSNPKPEVPATPTSGAGGRSAPTAETLPVPHTTLAHPDSLRDEDLASLLDAGETALAYHAATAMTKLPLAGALRALTLAEAVRTETGPTAAALRDQLEELGGAAVAADRSAQLLTLGAAVRASLMTPDPSAGQFTYELADSIRGFPQLTRMATEIGRASERGHLSGRELLATLAPVADVDKAIEAASGTAQANIAQPRTLSFVRANEIIERWWSPSGSIGRLLDIAAHDRRNRLAEVIEQLRSLSKRTRLAKELNTLDIEVRASGRPLQGAARRKLVEYAVESLDVVSSWAEAAARAATDPADKGAPAVPNQLTILRENVHRLWVGAGIELDDGARDPDPLHAAAARLAQTSLAASVDLLDGRPLEGEEPIPAVALDRDLVRCPGLAIGTGYAAPGTPGRKQLLAAVGTTWPDAFDARIAQEDFAAARIALDVLSETAPDEAERLNTELEQSLARCRADIRARRATVSSKAEEAARLGQLAEEDRSEVMARLEAADNAREDLGAVRELLADIEAALPAFARAAQDALWDRVNRELNERSDHVPDTAVKAIKERIDAGDLATAEEYALTALAGGEPPSARPNRDLERFFPEFIAALGDGITTELIEAVRTGTTHLTLNFASLSAEERQAVGDGLTAWARLRADWNTQRRQSFVIRLPLRIAGIEYAKEANVDLPSSPNRRWIDLLGVTRVGDVRIPAFGSQTGDKIRLLMTRSVSDVRTLLAWIAQDTSDNPVLVAVSGVLSVAQRSALAQACAEQPEKVVAVLDDAALTYLAAYGSGRFATAERVLLGFAAINPYHPNATGNVPSEMFYGRKEERAELINPLGPSLIYGGRQLGKSALLHATARTFAQTRGQVAIYLSLPASLKEQNLGEVWDMIADELERNDISAPRRHNRQAAHYVTETVKNWLDADRERRLLLLLDECDRYFDVDAARNFPVTAQLRDLMNSTNRRFKPVFAGLHQVQRFAKLPNQPLAHLGTPISIGPLAPEPAYRLIHTPMESLGIRFAEEHLVHRILAYCNYQPKLLQLVGEALVRDTLTRRGGDGPPWLIDEDALERVIGSENVRQLTHENVYLTLNLDQRYKLIALIAAMAALEHGADYRNTTAELRRECNEWWPEGFSGQGVDEFRLLLKEMAGLGILVEAGGGWRLRSSNVLRLLGSTQAIQDELWNTDWPTSTAASSAEHARRPLDDGVMSPLTEQQMADLVDRGNKVRAVLGSKATGIHLLRAALHKQRGLPGVKFALCEPSKPEAYKRELQGGKPGEQHRVVICQELATMNLDSAHNALAKAAALQPQAGVTRTVVAIIDAEAPGLLDSILETSIRVDDELVPLRRATEDGIRTWLMSDDTNIARFSDATSQRNLLATTGGWPVLLDRVHSLVLEGQSAQGVCESIRTELATVEGAARLVEATGISGPSGLRPVFNQLVIYNDWMSESDFSDLVADVHPKPGTALALLRLLALLDERASDAALRAEPVLAEAWRVAYSTK